MGAADTGAGRGWRIGLAVVLIRIGLISYGAVRGVVRLHQHRGGREHPDAVAALERVIATGEPVLNVEVAVEGRHFEASCLPVRACRTWLPAAHASHARETVANCRSAAARAGGGAVRDDIAGLVAQARSTVGRTTANESSTPGQ